MARYSLITSNHRAGLMEVGNTATIIFEAIDDLAAVEIGPHVFADAIADSVTAEIWGEAGRQIWEKVELR